MIFNLNEQKVLSDPSGSSVFKGEKDFNDIVVNLPDNIDGHTATELNYVMHFVDSDGGYSTKILTVDSSGEALKATATVSTSITSKAQAFYTYVLMTDDEETVIGKTNGVIVMIRPVPDEENEIIPPADADKIIKGLEEIVKEATETIETATDTIEEATEAISSKQDKLTAGQNITIDEDNVISAEGGGVTSYNDLTDKPQIYVPVYNSFNELVGNENITIEDIINMTYGFCVRIDSQENKSLEPYNIYNHSLYSDKDLLVGRSISYYGKYDFDKLSNDLRCAGMWEARASQCKHVPAFISDLFVSGLGNYIFFITHYRSHVGVAGGAPMIRSVAGKDKNGNFRIYYQYIRLSDNNDGTISNQSDWVELSSGGSQIVSGVVNANGTITFTDSDGNTFTTSGSNLVTSGNEQISVGYDNGGFYFLFDDGQGA